MTELRLAEHGLELIEPDPYLFAPLPDGRSLVLGRDVDATAGSIASFSGRRCAPLSGVLRHARAHSSVRRQRHGEHAAGHRAALARRSVVDADDGPPIPRPRERRTRIACCDGRRCRPPISCRSGSSPNRCGRPSLRGGIFGTALGPRSAGSAAVLLHADVRRATAAQRLVRGGLGSLTSALASAARAAGAEIRTNAEVDAST